MSAKTMKVSETEYAFDFISEYKFHLIFFISTPIEMNYINIAFAHAPFSQRQQMKIVRSLFQYRCTCSVQRHTHRMRTTLSACDEKIYKNTTHLVCLLSFHIARTFSKHDATDRDRKTESSTERHARALSLNVHFDRATTSTHVSSERQRLFRLTNNTSSSIFRSIAQENA